MIFRARRSKFDTDRSDADDESSSCLFLRSADAQPVAHDDKRLEPARIQSEISPDDPAETEFDFRSASALEETPSAGPRFRLFRDRVKVPSFSVPSEERRHAAPAVPSIRFRANCERIAVWLLRIVESVPTPAARFGSGHRILHGKQQVRCQTSAVEPAFLPVRVPGPGPNRRVRSEAVPPVVSEVEKAQQRSLHGRQQILRWHFERLIRRVPSLARSRISLHRAFSSILPVQAEKRPAVVPILSSATATGFLALTLECFHFPPSVRPVASATSL